MSGLAQGFEFLEIELVVVGDDAKSNARTLQRVHIVAVIKIVIARELELAVRAGVQMEICANPLCPLCKDNPHYRVSS